MNKALQQINHYQFFHKLCKLPFIQAIWLYGSRARGNYRERSDIDLAILCSRATPEQWQKIVDIITTADTLLHIDYVRFDTLPDSSLLKKEIQHCHAVIHKREENKMSIAIVKQKLEQLGQALKRLEEACAIEPSETIIIDGTIQRFEFCIELFWKTLKKILNYEKIDVNTPRSVIASAYQNKLIEDEKFWLNMLETRNKTSHIYDESEARNIYQAILTYTPKLIYDYQKLNNLYYDK